jgi:hypothetical protein
MAEPIRIKILVYNRGSRDPKLDSVGGYRMAPERESELRWLHDFDVVEMVELSAVREEFRIEMEELKGRAEKMEKFLLDLSEPRCGFGPDWEDHEVLTHVHTVAKEALKP